MLRSLVLSKSRSHLFAFAALALFHVRSCGSADNVAAVLMCSQLSAIRAALPLARLPHWFVGLGRVVSLSRGGVGVSSSQELFQSRTHVQQHPLLIGQSADLTFEEELEVERG